MPLWLSKIQGRTLVRHLCGAEMPIAARRRKPGVSYLKRILNPRPGRTLVAFVSPQGRRFVDGYAQAVQMGRHRRDCRDTTLVKAVPRHKFKRSYASVVITSVVPNRDGPNHDRPSSRRANTDGARSRNAVPSTDMRHSTDTDADSRSSKRGKPAAGEAVRCRPRVAAGSRRGRRRKRQLVPTRRRRQLGHIRAFSWCCSHSIAGIEMTLVGMNPR